MLDDMQRINEAVDHIKGIHKESPQIGLILGSGLGDLAEDIEDRKMITYREIPHFPISTVAGHEGRMIFGQLSGKNVVAMQGRFHYYEGYTMGQVTFPVRVMDKLGIKTLLVTNAAGGINESYEPGDLMVIEDIINLQGTNPLIGPNLDDFGVRFPDMSTALQKDLKERVIGCAKKLNIPIKKGIYAGMTGPSFETPAEIRMLRLLGADAVGMSTIPEIIVAKHGGLGVVGISCISNMAAGILDQPLNHQEVIETTSRIKEKFKKLVKEILLEI